MSEPKQFKQDIQLKLLDSTQQVKENIQEVKTATPVIVDDFEYKQFGAAPKITFSKLVLVIITPVLIAAHIVVARVAQIPLIQFGFVSLLVAFVVNYTAIIRKYQLRPYLKQQVYDNKLKLLIVMGLTAMLLSLKWGWNGTSGMIFASFWEYTRGNKMGSFMYTYLIIIIGSLSMEQYYGWSKLLEFIPGLMIGYINSTLFTMSQSPSYTIAHQFLFLCSMAFPMFFPATKLIVPSLWQWGLMVACGISVLFTTVVGIQSMKQARVSISVASWSGILMIGTTLYIGTIDYIGAGIILVGLVWMLKKEYLDTQQ